MTRTLEDGTIETAVHHPDGSAGITYTDPKTGRQTHYDVARMPKRGMPTPTKHDWLETALIIAVGIFFAAVLIVAAYYGR